MENTEDLCKQIWFGLLEIKARIFDMYHVMELFDIPVTRSIDDASYKDLERSSALAALVHEVSKITADKATAIFDLFEELEQELE